jgi:hypothetical protein
MADPLKIFTGLLDAIGETAPAVKAAKPAAKATNYFSDIAGKAKTGADYFADIVKTKQDVPKPANIPKPSEKSLEDQIADLMADVNKPAAPAAPKPTFAGQATKTAQQQALAPTLPPTVKPPTMHSDVLPEAARQEARAKGNYVTEAFRGMEVKPGGDFGPEFKGDRMFSSVSTRLADMYTSYISKHPGTNPQPGAYKEGASVVPMWIDTSDYLLTDAKGKQWTEFNAGAIQQAKAQGKKGVVIDNVVDEPNSTNTLGPQKIFVTFPDGQSTVKSKFAARFDPTSKDISRGIAAVGITGAAGGIAMAPTDAKAGEDPEALPANSAPTEGKGYFADIMKPASTEGQDYFADIMKPKSRLDVFKGAVTRSPDDPDAIAPSTAASYPGRVKDIPGDIKDVFGEGVKDLKEGKTATGEAFSKEELQTYNKYTDEYVKWLDGDGKGPAPTPPETGPLKALKGIGGVAGGFVGAVTSPIMGAFRALVSRPTEENTGVKHEITEAVGNLFLPGYAVSKGVKGVKQVPTAVREVGTFLNKIFNPEKIGKGDRAETLIRNSLGIAARDTETTRASFDEYFKAVNKLDDNDKVALIGYIEGRTKGAAIKDPALQPVADTIKTAVDQRKVKLQSLPSTHQMAFVEDYYTHQWENPQMAQSFTKSWYGKQGTGKNLQKRSIPTIADGIAAGLTPKTLNPLETITDYVTNMDRFIAHNAIIDAGRATKDVKYFRKPQVAAKLGLEKLEGRLSMRRTSYGDMQAYAPKDWARVYNNSIAKGWHQWETAGQIYDKLQTASNSITAMELGLSGYHLLTMVNEGSIASVATAVSQAVSGVGALSRGELKLGAKLLAGSAKSAATAPFALGVKPYMGHKAQQVYLGRSAGSAQMRKTMDLLEAGGGRAIGTKHAADYKFSAANSYFTAFKRGELRASLTADASKGPLRFFARQMGRTLQSFAQPLFEVYIPKMKVGAFHENMSAWLQANPKASYPDQVAMAKKVWDSVDNRFGEVVQDNIFWHTMMKQTAQLGMRSYSWNLGTVREIGGGAKAALTKPKSLGLKGTSYDPKTGYVVALPITVAITNGLYQYAMTGKMPESLDDLVAPRTGGQVPGTGGGARTAPRLSKGRVRLVRGLATRSWQQDVDACRYRRRAVGEQGL